MFGSIVPPRLPYPLWAMLVALALVVAGPEASEARCFVPQGQCSGCGCKGGPGYRELVSGRCVGFRDINKKCGYPPSSSLCTFEGADGYGANKECALGQKKRRNAPE
jgi:hypothetical protein